MSDVLTKEERELVDVVKTHRIDWSVESRLLAIINRLEKEILRLRKLTKPERPPLKLINASKREREAKIRP